MWLTALIMGLAGSLHCAGMCSPLAMAITHGKAAALKNRILYNFGRISTYAVLGFVIASMGYVLPLNGFQDILSISLGVALVVMACIGITGIRTPLVTKVMMRFTSALKRTFARFIQHKSPAAMLFLGALNGLLPCGLTFLALSFCLTVPTPLEGFTYMFTFGLGTLPVMIGFVSVVDVVTKRLRWNMKTVTTTLMAVSGLLLIARVFLVHLPDGHQHASLLDTVICR